MTEITIRFHTDQKEIDPAFFDNLNAMAREYGLFAEEKSDNTNSAQIVREGREWLDERDMKRAALSKGPRQDFTHLDRRKG